MNGQLLALTSSSVRIIECSTLKSDVSTLATPVNVEGATCSAWTAEGDALIGTSTGSIEKLDKTGATIGRVYSSEQPVVALVVRDATVVVGHADSVVFANGSTGTLIGTSVPVNGLQSLALSNDKDLLAIITDSSVTIRNLVSNVSTQLNLRHLPPSFGQAVFHPLKRTILVVARVSQLVVFDTTKPTGPIKIVSLGSTKVVDLTFFPNGKGLGVANDNGDVYIVDIDKDKAITRTIDFKEKLASIAVSPDSGSVIVGTISGQILVQDIRTSDKPIRSISTGSQEAIVSLILHRKTAPIRTVPPRTASATVTTGRDQPLGDRNVQRTVSTSRLTRKVSAESENPVKEVRTKVSAPLATPGKARKPLRKDAPAISDHENTASPPGLSNVTRRRPASPRDKKPAPTINKVTRRTSGTTASSTASPVSVRSVPRSRASTERISPASERTQRRVSSALSRATTGRTPSPDLPVVGDVSTVFQGQYEIAPIEPADEEDEITASLTPIVAIDLSDSPRGASKQLPETDPWLAAAKKTSAKADYSGTKTPTRNESTPPVVRLASHKQMELVPSTPPRRATLPNKRAFGSGIMQVSPMRSPAGMSTPNASTAHAQEIIRAVVREALVERDDEHREELRAMHLDLVKMSRTMKNDLRALMQEYVGDFKSLHEENQRLRAENERLRRGY